MKKNLLPPLGWNSWDCFGTTLTEAQAKAQADAMARQDELDAFLAATAAPFVPLAPPPRT